MNSGLSSREFNSTHIPSAGWCNPSSTHKMAILSLLSITKLKVVASSAMPEDSSSSSPSSSVSHNPNVIKMKPNKLPKTDYKKQQRPSVLEIERAIGAGIFRDRDVNSGGEDKTSGVIDNILKNSVGKDEGSVEKSLRETGEWLARQTDTICQSAEISRNFHPSPTSFSRNYEQYTRGFQSLSETSIPSVQTPTENGSCSATSIDQTTSKCISNPTNDDHAAAVKHQVNSNLKVSQRHDFAMIFTCKVCDTRNLKTACRESYDKGVVVARCSGCNNLHLIADRLGWFGEPGSVEDLLAARGEEVKKGSADTLNLTLEDFAGRKDFSV